MAYPIIGLSLCNLHPYTYKRLTQGGTRERKALSLTAADILAATKHKAPSTELLSEAQKAKIGCDVDEDGFLKSLMNGTGGEGAGHEETGGTRQGNRAGNGRGSKEIRLLLERKKDCPR